MQQQCEWTVFVSLSFFSRRDHASMDSCSRKSAVAEQWDGGKEKP